MPFPETVNFTAHDEQDTVLLAAALERVLPAGCVLALDGTLGAGKTRLVQALAQAAGIDRREVISPTFVLVQEYHGRRSIYHVDAYRLRDVDEFAALGLDERFDENVLVCIEWAERVAVGLPGDRIEIRITVTGDHERQFVIRATSPALQPVLARLQDELA